MPRSRKINQKKVFALLNKTCPKCAFTITPDLVKRVDLEWIECPKCGEEFQIGAKERESMFSGAMAEKG
jgi:ribosomal protein L37AE/L43A